MTRLIVILVVAFVGVVIYGAKAAFGATDGTMPEEVSNTLRKASNGVEWLKEQWQSGKER